MHLGFKPKAIKFTWRLLVPTLGSIWVVIALLVYFQKQREDTFRIRAIETHLDMMAGNVLDAYDAGLDLNQFVDFIHQYYTNTAYAGVRVSVYTYDGKLIHAVGQPLPFKFSEYAELTEETAPIVVQNEFRRDMHAFNDRLFYYMTQKSTDGKVLVLSAMPYTVSIRHILKSTDTMWWYILPIAIIASIFVIFFINHISRSVRQLARFADNAAKGKRPAKDYEFPNDEIGQISRRIIEIYRDRVAAGEAEEREHKVALNAIIEKARFKREMSNNISHEIKTPLGIIKGYIDTILAQEGDMDPQMTRHFLTRAQNNVDRLTQLVNDISIITRLEDGVKQITLEPVNFHDILYKIDDEMRESGILEGMKFVYNVPLTTIVHGNIQLLIAMLYNLIRNAVRYSHGTTITVAQTDESNDYYSFSFYDDGTGVAPEHLPHLFERFYRVEKGRSSKSGGTGLGLPIVEDTVNAHGGAISVKNRSGGGLEFSFTLRKWKSHTPTQHPENSETNSKTDSEK